MSASDKKKLRKEQKAAMLTERQKQEQAEAKKLKAYTIGFVAIMLAIVCVVVGIVTVRGVKNAGLAEKATIAAVIGDRELNSVEFNYYYNDAINDFYNAAYSQSSSNPDTFIQAIYGLDTTKPLNEQIYEEETGETWADYFINEAINKAKRDYALTDKAKVEGFTLPEEDKTSVENMVSNMSSFAAMYGFSNANQYLRATYGNGASTKTYKAYYERTLLAQAFYDAHEADITYDDAALREYEADNYDDYSSFTYDSVYLGYTSFQTGGTEDEDGKITYSEEENNAARDAMKAAAEELATATNLEELKAKLAEVKVKEGVTLSVTESKATLFTQIDKDLGEWLAAEDRADGQIAAIPVMSDEEEPKLNGYYVAIFHSRDDNKNPMGNVRHLLVEFEGGEEDEETGEMVYSEEEKNAAKEKAEGFLKTWQEGEKTEASFTELLKENSDDTGVTENEGLYENINPSSNYVENFRAWAIDPERKEGDTGVIETEYGYHVMYYVGDSELTYRDHMLTEEKRVEDQEAWYNAILESVTTEKKDTSKLKLDLVLNSAG